MVFDCHCCEPPWEMVATLIDPGTEGQIRRYGPTATDPVNGIWIRTFNGGVATAGFGGALRILSDIDGNTYVAGRDDVDGNDIKKYDRNGVLQWAVDNEFDNQSSAPNAIALNSSQQLVAEGGDFGTGSHGQIIQLFDVDGNVLWTSFNEGSETVANNVQGIVVDNNDDVFVLGTRVTPLPNNGTVWKLDGATGALLDTFDVWEREGGAIQLSIAYSPIDDSFYISGNQVILGTGTDPADQRTLEKFDASFNSVWHIDDLQFFALDTNDDFVVGFSATNSEIVVYDHAGNEQWRANSGIS